MTVEMAYDEYLGRIPSQHRPSYKVKSDAISKFLSSILGPDGMPVIIVNINKNRMIMLWDKCGEDDVQCQFNTLNAVFSSVAIDNVHMLDHLAANFSDFIALLTSSREKAVALCIMTQLFSNTKMRHLFKISEDRIANIKRNVTQCLNDLQEVETSIACNSETKVQTLIEDLEIKLEQQINQLQNSSNRMSKIDDQCLREDTENKKDRISILQLNPKILAINDNLGMYLDIFLLKIYICRHMHVCV